MFMSKKTFNFKKIKKEYLIVLILAIVAIFFVFNSFKDISKQDSSKVESENTAVNYVEGLENKLEEALSSVKGVGKVNVSISVSSSFESVYATEKKTTLTEKGEVVVESPIIVGGKTVLIKENFPKISGVIIVVGGADNINIKANIMNTVVNFLEIDSKKVIILNGKK